MRIFQGLDLVGDKVRVLGICLLRSVVLGLKKRALAVNWRGGGGSELE